MPPSASHTMAHTSAASLALAPPDLHDKKNNERLRRLEPYLLDRTDRKAASTEHKSKSSCSSKPTSKAASPRRRGRLGVRRFLRNLLHFLTFAIIHVIFSIYIRVRQAYHAVVDHVVSVFSYHHRTPELIQRDIRHLKKLPRHMSVILNLEDQSRGASLERLMNDVADIAAWCACTGVPTLSIYEKTGILKAHIPATHGAVSQKLGIYFGQHKPALTLSAPLLPSISSASSSPASSDESDAIPTNGTSSSSPSSPSSSSPIHRLRLILLSSEDGRDSIVDLTKTLAEMSQCGKISPQDISVDVVDAELKEGVVAEPDLLVVFGAYPDLQGYPPWHLRLTEIYCLRDSVGGVGYQVFLRGLCKFASAEMRWGR